MSVSAPAGTEWSGEPLGRNLQRQTPDQMASKMLAEKRDLNQRTRLTWNKEKVPISGEGKFVGEVCLSLPYVNVERKYLIQNCRIYKTNGEEISLEKLYEVEADKGLYLRVAQAYESHLKEAKVHDAGLCKHCSKFRSDTLEVMMQHIVDEHPQVLAAMAGVDVSPKTDTEAPWCQSCDKTFKNASGLRLHRLQVHDKAV